jgi:signal transduction histidine kinase
MGLYITATIIRDHGGKIWAESDGATGTTLFFSIPRLSN